MNRPVTTLALAASLATALVAAPVTAASAEPLPERARAPYTNLTLDVVGCDGCTLTASSADAGSPTGWISDPQLVAEGQVLFTAPSEKTSGLSIQVSAPWEGATGYATHVAFRYNGVGIGKYVGFKKARKKKRASGCWAGTVNDAVTLKVKVRRVRVSGNSGRVPGLIAWTPSTQSYLPPMLPAYRGVLGSQEPLGCQTYASYSRPSR